MKNIFLITVLILTSLNTLSQEKGVVYYGHIESKGLKAAIGPDFNAYLVFNNTASYYVTKNDSLDKGKEFKTRYSSEDGMSVRSYLGQLTTQYGNQVYNNRKKDSIYWNQWIDFYVAEKTPKINWQLKNKTKQIGKFTVHKAVANYRGRSYTAWYALDIPLPYGPWKLQGLPGLILEAYDADKEMYFYFKSIEYPTTNSAIITQLKRPKDHPNTWHSLQGFKDRLDDIYEKMKINSILIAEKYNAEVPEQKIKSEAFIESF